MSRELFHRFTRSPISFGALGVDGFFVLSGYLIVQSWLGDPEFLNFLRKRVLRIVPGYLVAVVLSTLAVGLLAPGTAHFFRGIDIHFVHSVVLLSSPMTPPVFPGRPYATVNGSMWTIAYEFRCYLLVALLGLCGLLRRPSVVLVATILLLSSLLYPAPFGRIHWPRHVEAVVGQPALSAHLTGIYLVGCCFYLFRDRVVFRPLFAWAAVAVLAGFFVFSSCHCRVCSGAVRQLPDVLSRPDASAVVVVDEQISRHLLWDLSLRMARRGPVDLVPPRLALDHLFRVDGNLFWPRLVELALHRAPGAYLEAEGHSAPACWMTSENDHNAQCTISLRRTGLRILRLGAFTPALPHPGRSHAQVLCACDRIAAFRLARV